MKFQEKMLKEIILASKSLVRKKILEENGIKCTVEPSNIDEDLVKESLIKENAPPKLISKNLAELKANKVSQKKNGSLVLGADSIINLNEKIISKPSSRGEALTILEKLNGQKHQLISSVCVSKNGSMVWNYTDIAVLTMKQMTKQELKSYLNKIKDKELYAYNVYQIEGEGRSLFSKIEGDENTIMGLPVKKIKEYLNNMDHF
jgi:septum formation protein